MRVPKYEKVDYEQLVKNSVPRKSGSIKKAALETNMNQSTRNEESPERNRSSQMSKSPNRPLDSCGRARTPRREGINLISYFFEWMSRTKTIEMHPFQRDGSSKRGNFK